MPDADRSAPAPDLIELGDLFAGAVASVVAAQAQLDRYTRERVAEARAAEPGAAVIPPLWFTFKEVEVEIAMSAAVARVESPQAPPTSALLCRLVNPTSVGLYGYTASSGLRVRARVGPEGWAMLTPPRDIAPGVTPNPPDP